MAPACSVPDLNVLQRVGCLSLFPALSENRMQKNLMPWALAIEGGLGLAAVGLGWLVGYPPADAVPQWTAADFAAEALSAIPMLAGLIVLVRVPWRPFVELLRVIDESVAPLFRGVRLGEMAVIAGLAGLGEEMLFRGVIQGHWPAGSADRSVFGSHWASLRCSSAWAMRSPGCTLRSPLSWASTLAACCWQPTICWFPSPPMPSMIP